MPTLSITNGFDRLSDPDLETRSYQVLAGVTENPAYFPTPKPTLAEMGGFIGNFFDALNASKDGDRQKIAIKNQKRKELIDALHLWSAYVLSQSGGDPVIAIASNFSIRKTPANKPPITKPENFSMVAGSNPFELAGRVQSVDGATGYIFQYAKDAMMAQNNWQGVPSTKTKCTIANLESGVIYNCRVVAIGPRNQVMYSDVLRCRVA
ncbi:MAG: hypothetical protein ABI691_17310 [Ginsengibacter sp.]